MKIFYISMYFVSACLSSFAQPTLQVESMHIDSIQVDEGWNLISLPVKITSGTKSSLFPDASSLAFIYQNGYLSKDTLENGIGFWLKYHTDETVYFTGDRIWEDTIEVHDGWNMVGSITRRIDVDSIQSSPPGIITSEFFGYFPGIGYPSVDTLLPGHGYWVKVNQNGSIILRIPEGNHPPNQPSFPNPVDYSTGIDTNITLSWICTDPDNDPLTYDVYFGTDDPPLTIVSSEQADTFLLRNDLTPNTTYYWQIIANDDSGNSTSGEVWRFSTRGTGTWACGDTIEYSAKTYNTVPIGSQCWLKENLDVGTMILGSANQIDDQTIEKYCYNDEPAKCDTFGGLYQWNEAMQYSTVEGAQGICPAGWHIPTYAEFQICSTSVNGDGNALKAIGQGAGEGIGTNTSGFSCLLSAYRTWYGFFKDLGLITDFWSSKRFDTSTSVFMELLYNDGNISFYRDSKDFGFSVRCIRD